MVRTAPARSRDDLRRGLFVSGAMHLALLYVVLHLPHGSDEVLVRSYSNPVDIFHQTEIPLREPPAPAPPTSAPSAREGRFTPVIDPPEIELPADLTGGAPGPGPQGKPGDDKGVEPNPGPPPAPGPDPNGIFQINQVDVLPVPTYAPKPPYPEFAREADVTGRVVLQVLVRADGSVAKVTVKSGIRVLADAAQETLYRWRFQPARSNGRPVSVWVEVPVVFTL
jgi:periplasmic protein TonB